MARSFRQGWVRRKQPPAGASGDGLVSIGNAEADAVPEAGDAGRFARSGLARHAAEAGHEGEVLPLEDQRQFIGQGRSEEHTSELQSLMRNSYSVYCLKKKKQKNIQTQR